MSKLKVSKLLNDVVGFTKKHAPEILTGLGIVGMFYTIKDVHDRATPNALTILDEEWNTRNVEGKKPPSIKDLPKEFTFKERVQLTWKCYIPTAISGGVSTACLIGANTLNGQQKAALTTAYTLSEAALKEYRDKTVELVGEEKEKEIRDKVAQERIEKIYVKESDIIETGHGNDLFYDYASGRQFRACYNWVEEAKNNLNALLLDSMYASLNDFYTELEIPRIGLGELLGWDVNKERKVDIRYSTAMTQNHESCIVIEYCISPRYDYRSLY